MQSDWFIDRASPEHWLGFFLGEVGIVWESLLKAAFSAFISTDGMCV